MNTKSDTLDLTCACLLFLVAIAMVCIGIQFGAWK
jgi:hypothetical protein